MSKEFSGIKELAGEPWSNWKMLMEKNLSGIQHINGTNRSSISAHCIKLKREDFPIFGVFPKSEVFELVICNMCGNKFKLPALSAHISLRHGPDSNYYPSIVEESSKACIPRRSSIRKRERPKHTKIKELPTGPDLTYVNFLEIVSDRQSLPNESETVSKIKQINVKLKKTQLKCSEHISPCMEENGMSDSASPSHNTNKSDSKYDISKQFVEPIAITANVKVEGSSLPQNGFIINMQPVVQLSLLNSIVPPDTIYNHTGNSESKKANLGRKLVKRKKSYHPDLHCGVVGKENAKPCTRSLNCNTHSVHLKRAVCGRTKSLEQLLENFQKKGLVKSSHKPVESVISNPSMTIAKPHLTTNSKPHVTSSPISAELSIIEKDDLEMKSKGTKRLAHERPRLSLPVSIKNPTIVGYVKKAKREKHVSSDMLQSILTPDVLKGTFVQQQLLRNPLACQASKENLCTYIIRKDGYVSGSINQESQRKKLEGFQQWHPGYRRVGGLLYSNHNMPAICSSSFVTSVTPLKIVKKKIMASHESMEIIDLCDDDDDEKQSPNELTEETKHITTLRLGPLLPAPPAMKNYIIHKQNFIQSLNNSTKSSISKRTSNNNINGIYSTKVKRQENMVNFITPEFGKNDQGLPVMHIEVNNGFDKKLQSNNQHLRSPNNLGSNIQVEGGLNVIRGNSLHGGPPRVHLTTSGSLPLSIQQVSRVQQELNVCYLSNMTTREMS